MFSIDFPKPNIDNFISYGVFYCRNTILSTYRAELTSHFKTLILSVKNKNDYPCLNNIPKLINDILSCCDVKTFKGQDHGLVSVTFDSTKALKLGIPHDICNLIDYGSSTFPKPMGGTRKGSSSSLGGGPLKWAVGDVVDSVIQVANKLVVT